MRTVTRTYDIYNYRELTDEAKGKARSWYLNDSFRPMEFENDYTEDLRYLFKNSSLNLQFSLSCCQGDGLNIYGQLDLEDIFTVISDKSYCGELFKDFWDIAITGTSKLTLFLSWKSL